MADQKSSRSLTQIIKKNQIEELNEKLAWLEEQLKAKEILLINLEKLSSLGQFVREIIHELKNPLTAVSGFTELGKLAKNKKDREEYLDKIPKFINQITSRLSQFRSMTFNTGINYHKIDLAQIMAESLATLELLKPKGSLIESNFNSIDCSIIGDGEQWLQVFLGISKMFFKYMKEVNSTFKVKVETLNSNELGNRIKDINISSMPVKDWQKNIEKNRTWVKISFENKKIQIPDDKLNQAFGLCTDSSDLNHIGELGVVIACDIVRRHQGNIYIKNSKPLTFSLHVCVPQN